MPSIATVVLVSTPPPALTFSSFAYVIWANRYDSAVAIRQVAPHMLAIEYGSFKFAGTQGRILPRRFLNMGGVPIAIQ